MEPNVLASPLEIRLFGMFDVQLNGSPLPPLRSRKGKWLLALLILKRSTPVDRSWLAGTLWPETTEDNAFSSLRKSLTDLRQALGSEGWRLHSPTPRTLAFDLSNVFCDLSLFDACLAKPPAAGLEQAIALYRGALLEGCCEDWIVPERIEREQAYLIALETLAVSAMERGDYASAIEALRLSIGVDPLRESSQRRLMQALAAEGNYAAVTKTYRDLRLYLYRELHTEPDAETFRLYEQLKSDGRNLTRPTVSSMASSVEPAKPKESYPTSYIPVPVTELVGRAREIEEIELSLRRARLVTVMGTGGAGKTRLAIEVAQRCLGRYKDGVWFVELAALTDASLVAQTIATLLGVREQPGASAEESLLPYLRTQETLLVLDNCEHLIHESVRLAGVLLGHCPELSLLVTSRQALGITGEAVWRIPSLSLPDLEQSPLEKDLPAQLMEFDAVRLFVKRAVLVQPTFRLSPQNANAVVHICRRLDGIPLAIELAAARLRVLTPEQIAIRLEDLFHLLTGGSRTAMPRHQTLRSALDWSYDLLEEEERSLLRALSVFVGGWTLESAVAVCRDTIPTESWEVLDLLTSLLDKSLVIFKPGEEGDGRFYLLETVRHYGLDRLKERGEWEAIRNRHLKYFLSVAEESVSKLQGPEQGIWLNRMESEHDNLRVALQFCVEKMREKRTGANSRWPLMTETYLRLVCALDEFWTKRCYWSEGHTHLTEALALTEGAPLKLRALALIHTGGLNRKQGDYSGARALTEQGLLLARELQDTNGTILALQTLGALAIYEGNFGVGKTCFEEGLKLSREIENRHGVAACLLNLATISQPEGDHAKSRRLLQESLEIFRELGDKASIGVILNNLGNMLYWERDYPAALKVYGESLEIRRELGNKSGIAVVLMHLGNVYNELGDHERALQYLGESLSIRRKIGERQQVAYTLHNLASIAFHQRDFSACAALHRESVALMREVMDRPALIVAFEALACLATEEGRTVTAVRLWAVSAAQRELLRFPLPPAQNAEREQQWISLRAILKEETFDAEWQQASTLTLEEALDHIGI